ncbi:MAG: undecaprenyl-diphosphate phosphatase [Oscillospiraceae bacterium]|nr:undecaprenyl-diphosphate phosphatase [Oscillospiraceae bacterium]MBR6430563.1 undecaprenyl-diphosphate phosphatase [Oscillospiraceae bacterium]
MTILAAILLAIVQGITEFLPVSSSGHLAILQNIFKLSGTEGHLFFDVLLHFGTLVSICYVYRKDLRDMIQGCVNFARGDRENPADGQRMMPNVRMVVMIIISTLPLFLALPFKSKIESLYYKTGFIGFALLVTGGILYIAERFIVNGRKNARTMTLLDALIIGVAQAFALFPGLSRSGTSISVARAFGLEKNFAVRYSLLMSIPAVLGSTILSLFSAMKSGIVWASVPAYLIGMVIAAAVGILAINVMSNLMKRGKFKVFSYYCWALGATVLIVSIFI